MFFTLNNVLKKKIQSFVGFHEKSLDFKNNNFSESKAFISETQKEKYLDIMIINCEIIHLFICAIEWIIYLVQLYEYYRYY